MDAALCQSESEPMGSLELFFGFVLFFEVTEGKCPLLSPSGGGKIDFSLLNADVGRNEMKHRSSTTHELTSQTSDCKALAFRRAPPPVHFSPAS